ncbi:hypothetical protein [Kurthia sp. ISK08]|uniref:hypothetical protein n=1 Tax=Kurthia sp. ISK08 TaxID=3385835 RepID=UPI0038FC6310
MLIITKKANIAKLGFVGIGMGGSRLAAECTDYISKDTEYPYNSLLVNMNKGDEDSICYNNVSGQRKILLGSGKGTGVDPAVGYYILDKERIKIERAIEEQFKESDFIFVTVGLGGGTGTGALLEIIKTLEIKGYKNIIGLMLILPRIIQGSTKINNTLSPSTQIEHFLLIKDEHFLFGKDSLLMF